MKKSNKGFSLVELIIVIAIMAILIAVLAPQYLKYVEKTKKNSDAKAFGEVVQATEVAIADPLNKTTADTVSVSWTNGTTITINGADQNLIDDVCVVIKGQAGSGNTFGLDAKSKAFKNSSSQVDFSIVGTDGNWKKSSSGIFQSYVDY